MTAGVLILAALLSGPAAPTAPAEEEKPWASLLGSGLLTLQDTRTVPPGRFMLAFTIDNRDRDPLGLDLVDGSIAWTIGVTRWAEIYGHHVFSRSVAVPDTPVLPPPPLDTIVPPGTRAPDRPYYSLYSDVPYVDDTGPIRFGSDIPGEFVLGAKARALRQRGSRPALAGSVEVHIPLTRDLQYLQAGSGTGAIDLRLGSIAQWQRNRWSFVATMGFTRVGRPLFPDRRIEWRDGLVAATDEPLLLPHRLDVGLGAQRPLGRALAAVAEAGTVFETGHRTRSLDRARPIDALAGFQVRWRRLRSTAALRYHGNTPVSMQVRPTPLAGLVDLTHVSRADMALYLRDIGLDGAEPLLRSGAHRLLVPPPGGPPLPAGARVIPDTYRIRSEHQVGFVLLWGVTF